MSSSSSWYSSVQVGEKAKRVFKNEGYVVIKSAQKLCHVRDSKVILTVGSAEES